jgi:uncharacterized CHY-type Zn-finger protein
MTAAYQVTMIESKDLENPTIVCGNCQSRTTIPIKTAPIPEQCPSCRKVFDDGFKNALAALSRFHREASPSFSIEFAIKGS